MLPVHLSLPAASAEALVASVPGADTRTAIREAHRDGEHLEIRLPMESVEIAASQLMGVPGVEVREPAELRRMICERAAALATDNQSRDTDDATV